MPQFSGVYSLEPVAETPLGTTLESVKQRFLRMGLTVRWHGSGQVLLPSEVLDAFLLALAECLENVRRHAGVEEADVTITQGDDVLLNLASNEYFSAVKRNALDARIINTDFKDLKNGQYKIISFYAKKARGLMSRFVIQEKINDPALLKQFDVQGYRYSAEQSKPDNLVFLRDHAPE